MTAGRVFRTSRQEPSGAGRKPAPGVSGRGTDSIQAFGEGRSAIGMGALPAAVPPPAIQVSYIDSGAMPLAESCIALRSASGSGIRPFSTR